MSDPLAPHPSPTRSTALLRSDRFLGHDTGGHPENAGRLAAIMAELTRHDLLRDRPRVPFSPATPDAVERVHDRGYLDALLRLAAVGGGRLDPDTIVRADSVEVALLAAGAATAAVDALLAGRVRRAFVLGRPPGHHATPSRGMGFCLINSVAVAAAHALATGLERVAVIDWDVHHGNGTQDAFVENDRVLFCSLHQSPLYPGTGAADERGRGRGLGFTINVPLPAGTDDNGYRHAFDRAVAPAVAAFRPQLLLLSAGFDAHQRDPLAGMRLSAAGFADLARRCLALAETSAEGRVAAILEGGYDPRGLAESVAAVVRVFDDDAAPVPRPVPPPATTATVDQRNENEAAQ